MHVKIRMIVSVDMRVDESEHVGIVGHTAHWHGAQLWLDILVMGLRVSLRVAVGHPRWSEECWRGDICWSEDSGR